MADLKLVISDDNEGDRIDRFLSEINEDLSRTYIQKCISEGLVTVNDKSVKASYIIKENDELIFKIPEIADVNIEPENIPLDIVYEDDDVCIVNKPRGMVVHPSKGHYSGTLVNALMFHLKDRLSGINGVMRPGIVHRIDKDTSGLLIICKNDFSHNHIALQLKDHSAERTYHAIVHGTFKESEGTVDTFIGRSVKDRKKMDVVPNDSFGKHAVTHYKVLEAFKDYSYIECKLETGRTHQIRVHMTHIGHPLMGDPVYGTQKEPIKLSGQMLHAKTIGFVSPSKNEFISFSSELPDDFMHALQFLRCNRS